VLFSFLNHPAYLSKKIVMKQFLLLIILIPVLVTAQTASEDFLKEILEFQDKLNRSYKDPEKSPLKKEKLESFLAHDFFPPNDTFRVEATFKRTPKEKVFKMKTTTERLPDYLKYGELYFELNGKQHRLNLYQNIQLSAKEEYKDYLFLPFTDLTSGSETYGGGRYIDFKIPQSKKVVLDFNKAYNPYCAYNNIYSCPIPPPENFIDEAIRAGVKYLEE
jgi:uncharacterized protein